VAACYCKSHAIGHHAVAWTVGWICNGWFVEGKISKDSADLTSFQSQAAVTGEACSLTVEKWMKYLKLERTHFVENLKWL